MLRTIKSFLKYTKNTFTLFLLTFFILFASNIYSQVLPYGLSGEVVTSLAITKGTWQKTLIAGTGNNGIYFHNFNDQDSTWIQHYFYKRTVSSVYIQLNGAGPAEFSGIFAALIPDSSDSTLIYFSNFPVQSFWSRRDSGLDNYQASGIKLLTGFDYSSEEPPLPMFASASDSIIYKLKDEVWQKSWNGPEYTSVDAIYSNKSTVWGGGMMQGGFGVLFMIKSGDYGENWKLIHPPFGEIYSCHSIVTPTDDSLTVYGGLNGLIIKSTDGGTSWNPVFTENDVTFNSLVINPSNPDEIFAGGKTIDNSYILQKSDNGGKDWEFVTPGINCCIKGITAMIGTILNNKFILFIATDGDGVFYYEENLVSAEEQNQNKPIHFELKQNYPNPFNPVTKIQYEIPVEASVSLKIFDLLGREVTTLVDKILKAGKYETEWNAKDIASGIYFYKIIAKPDISQAESFVSTKKLLLLR